MEPEEIYHIKLDEVDTRDGKMKMFSLRDLNQVKAIKIGKRACKVPRACMKPKTVELGVDLTEEVKRQCLESIEIF